MTSTSEPLRVGIGGPVGSGKTALTLALCRKLRDSYNIAVVTNDIYTKEDAEFLTRNEALTSDRIIGVETGGCPHTAIREDASMNLAAVAQLCDRFTGLDRALRSLADENAGDVDLRPGGSNDADPSMTRLMIGRAAKLEQLGLAEPFGPAHRRPVGRTRPPGRADRLRLCRDRWR